MPENEFEFQRICDRLRRLGHSQEPGSHMRAGAARDYFGDTNMKGMNAYYFPTFDGNSNQQLALAAPTQAAYMINSIWLLVLPPVITRPERRKRISFHFRMNSVRTAAASSKKNSGLAPSRKMMRQFLKRQSIRFWPRATLTTPMA